MRIGSKYIADGSDKKKKNRKGKVSTKTKKKKGGNHSNILGSYRERREWHISHLSEPKEAFQHDLSF